MLTTTSGYSCRDVAIDQTTAVLELRGPLDLVASPEIKRCLRAKIATGTRRLVIDLSYASFIDPSLLRVLAAALRAIRRAGGDMTVVCSAEHICRVLELTGWRSTAGISATRGEALARLGAIVSI